jgi:AbiV family abortive infection protein
MKPLNRDEADGAYRMSLENARALVSEGTLLLDLGHHARAYALAHLATEEVAKALMFSGVGDDLANGRAVDWKRVDERLRDHLSKIVGRLVIAALHDVSPPALVKADAESKDLNRLKNDSLYVGLGPAGFRTPAQAISLEAAGQLVQAAEELITMFEDADLAARGDFEAFTKTKSFDKWNRVKASLAELRASE